jgi:hypothetical protein
MIPPVAGWQAEARDNGDRMLHAGTRAQVHDFWPRVLLSPLLGVGIATLAGLIHHRAHSPSVLAGSYLYFSLLAFLVWEGNRRLYFRFRDPDAWFTHAWQRIAVLIGCVCLYTIPISIVGILAWRAGTGADVAMRAVWAAVLLIVICTIFIVHVYETVFLLRDWGKDRLRSEQLQRATVEAELEALKREINPHVLFNSLHALAHLVETGSPRATEFVVALASVYRHLLQARKQPLVTLGEEIDLLEQHALLAEIRCPGALRVEIDVPAGARPALLLPPVTLPELLENAIKHNARSAERPLTFSVRLDADDLIVANDRRPSKTTATPSTGVGLENLRSRFELTSGAKVTWTTTIGRQFVVRLGMTPASGLTPSLHPEVGLK